MTDVPLVSVVVTTRNSEKTIGASLESIRIQRYPRIELIVVDNFSTDKTLEIAQDFTTHIYQHGPERSAQRNFGLLQVGKGDVGAYFDADMILGPQVIGAAVDLLVSGVDSLYVPEVIVRSGIIGKIRRFERKAYESSPIDAVRIFKLSVFRDIGGFDEHLGPGPEDWDLTLRLKESACVKSLAESKQDSSVKSWRLSRMVQVTGDIPLCATCLYHDESEATFLNDALRKSYYVEGLRQYREKWSLNHPDLRCQLSVRNRLFGIFFNARNRRGTFLQLHLYIGFLALKVLSFIIVSVASCRGTVPDPYRQGRP